MYQLAPVITPNGASRFVAFSILLQFLTPGPLGGLLEAIGAIWLALQPSQLSGDEYWEEH